LRLGNHETTVSKIREELVAGRDVNVNEPTRHAKIALRYAAKYGNIEAATFLIEREANVIVTAALYQLARRPENLKIGCTPLHYTTRADDSPMILVLLKHEADPSIQSKRQETPFELAWIKRRDEALCTYHCRS
jgi:ankyrin repeat protein